MRSINARLARLERDAGVNDSAYWCEETSDSIIYHSPLGDVTLPRKGPYTDVVQGDADDVQIIRNFDDGELVSQVVVKGCLFLV